MLKYVRLLTMTNEEFSRLIAQTSGHTLAGSELAGDGPLLDVMLSENSLLTRLEQVAVFMNLAIPGITAIPKGAFTFREAPSDVPLPPLATFLPRSTFFPRPPFKCTANTRR